MSALEWTMANQDKALPVMGKDDSSEQRFEALKKMILDHLQAHPSGATEKELIETLDVSRERCRDALFNLEQTHIRRDRTRRVGGRKAAHVYFLVREGA